MKKNIQLFAGIGGIALYFVFIEVTGLAIPCVFHALTDLLCPGCGGTRMFKALLRGDIVKAYYYNKFIFLSLPIFFVLFIDLVYSNFKNKKPLINRIPTWIYFIYIDLLVVFGVIRNII